MRILGIDPGLRITGYGVVDCQGRDFELVEAGIIRTDSKQNISFRLCQIYEGIESLLKDLKPELMALEKLFSDYRHPTTAILMGHARGVICLAASKYSVPLGNMPSTRVKKAIVSNGHASKHQISETVTKWLKLKKPFKFMDVSDALAVAMSYYLTHPTHEEVLTR